MTRGEETRGRGRDAAAFVLAMGLTSRVAPDVQAAPEAQWLGLVAFVLIYAASELGGRWETAGRPKSSLRLVEIRRVFLPRPALALGASAFPSTLLAPFSAA